MPTERFYRLPKEKADTIRRAAIEEFKRVTPEEASINKIIQSAEISRGSFYTYFEDKYDLLRWVIGDFIESYRQFYVTGLKANGGDLWDVFDRVLIHSIQWVDEQGLVEIVGNMMRGSYFADNMHQASQDSCKIEEENRSYAELMYQNVDPECCSLDFVQFHELMGMHVATLIVALKTYFADNVSLDEIQTAYRRRMNIMRYGACPRPEQAESDRKKGQE